MRSYVIKNVIKRVNMQVYNFLMRLNETRNVFGMKISSVYVN